MKNLLPLAGATLALAVLATPSHAQTISWDGAQTLTGDADISTSGTYVDAATFGATTTVETVPFNTVTSGTTSVGDISLAFDGYITYGAFPTSGTASAGLSTVVSTIGYTHSYDSPAAVMLSGLTAGDTYQVQVFDFDASDSDTSVATTLTGTTPVSFDDPNSGQFAIGTFVAPLSGTETFDYEPATAESAFGIINAVSLRDITTVAAVPEPSTWALLLGGALMLVVISRHRAGRNA